MRKIDHNIAKAKIKAIARVSKSSVLFPFRILSKNDKPPNDEEASNEILEAHFRKEIEDLKINLRINKESLTSMLAELQLKENKEKSLIETINIIS